MNKMAVTASCIILLILGCQQKKEIDYNDFKSTSGNTTTGNSTVSGQTNVPTQTLATTSTKYSAEKKIEYNNETYYSLAYTDPELVRKIDENSTWDFEESADGRFFLCVKMHNYFTKKVYGVRLKAIASSNNEQDDIVFDVWGPSGNYRSDFFIATNCDGEFNVEVTENTVAKEQNGFFKPQSLLLDVFYSE